MKRLWRSVRLIIELWVAFALFFVIVKNTPLFDRALPDRNPTPTQTSDTITITGTMATGQDSSFSTIWTVSIDTTTWWVWIVDTSDRKIVYMPWLWPVVTNFSADTINTNSALATTIQPVERPLSVGRSCTTPWWMRLADGDATIAYKAVKVDTNNRCVAEIRSCRDGVLRWSYQHQACIWVTNGVIKLPDGTVVEVSPWATNDTQQLIDLSNYLAWREKYEYERTTQPSHNNDTLTLTQARPQDMTNAGLVVPTWPRGDVLDQVTVRDPRYIRQRSCRTPRWERIDHASYVYAFERETGRLWQHCTVQKRACINGDLSGTYRYETCTYLPGLPNPLALTSIPNVFNEGSRFTRAPYVTPFEQNLWNTSHLWSLWWGTSTQPRTSCEVPRWGTVRHGFIITAYNNLTWSATNPCQRELRTCYDGELSGTFTHNMCRTIGALNPPNYISPAPVHNYASCRTPRGGRIWHNQTITAYRLPHSTANSLCDPQIRRCRDGELSGTYGYQTCRNDTRPLSSPSRRWKPWTWW